MNGCYIFLERQNALKITVEWNNIRGQSAVYDWVNEFKLGTLTSDEHRSELPLEVTTPEIIDNDIHDMVFNDS